MSVQKHYRFKRENLILTIEKTKYTKNRNCYTTTNDL